MASRAGIGHDERSARSDLTGRPPPASPPDSGSGTSRRAQLALGAFAAYCAVAAIVIPTVIGKDRWFFGDEWEFIAGRHDHGLADLFTPFQQHWTTLPIVTYRLLYAMFGVRTYVPYLMVVVVLHLTTAALLRVVMRRVGVGPWIATITASILVLFGPGEQNIVWAFQIAFDAALVFGLLQLLGADHDGPIDRRDWLGLLAGALGLMCSGVAPVMVAVVGVAALVRRGWRPALFHTAPLVALYLTWATLAHPLPDVPLGGRPPIGTLLEWIRTGWAATFQDIGHFTVVAVALAVVLVVGLAVAWAPLDRPTFRRTAAAPLALLIGVPAFFVSTAWVRGAFGPAAASASRYVYVAAALTLPALGVAADGIVRRWHAAAPVVVGLLLIGMPFALDNFGDTAFNADYFTRQKEIIVGSVQSPSAATASRDARPLIDPYTTPDLDVGWLLDAERDGKLPPPRQIDPGIASTFPVRLGIVQSRPSSPPVKCRPSGPLPLRPAVGDRVVFGSAVSVTTTDDGVSPTSPPVAFTPDHGNVLTMTSPELHLILNAAPPAKTFVLCG
jgi:hypothetical protein